MFKRLSFFTFLLAFSVPCFGLTLSDGTEVLDLVSLVDTGYSRISLGLEFSNYKYREIFPDSYPELGNEVMNLTGSKSGLVLEIFIKAFASEKAQQFLNDIFFSAQFLLMQGDVIYDGHLMDGTPLKLELSERDVYSDFRFLFGKVFSFFSIKSITETLYMGMGYRRLINKGTDAGTYDRVSRYLYIPIGLTTDMKLGIDWSLSINSEFDYLIYGVQETDKMNPLRHLQNKGHGIRIGITANKKLKKSRMFFGPFIRYWDIACSEKLDYYDKGKEGEAILYTSCEPRNYTVEYGLKVGVDFNL
ncbi:MAG: hypothetical protein LBP57_03935 [Endomicrobium sp.]|jgi:hypothetical protein|nr:hypothetical protein [Endomicrobium sp.]